MAEVRVGLERLWPSVICYLSDMWQLSGSNTEQGLHQLYQFTLVSTDG